MQQSIVEEAVKFMRDNPVEEDRNEPLDAYLVRTVVRTNIQLVVDICIAIFILWMSDCCCLRRLWRRCSEQRRQRKHQQHQHHNTDESENTKEFEDTNNTQTHSSQRRFIVDTGNAAVAAAAHDDVEWQAIDLVVPTASEQTTENKSKKKT